MGVTVGVVGLCFRPEFDIWSRLRQMQLSGVPDGTSPGVLNRKRVSLLGVEREQVNGACQVILSNPAQLKVISPEE